MPICYFEEVDFDPEELGEEAWLTGCMLCGASCWSMKTKEECVAIEIRISEENNRALHDQEPCHAES